MDLVCDELGFKWTHRLVGYGQVFRRRNGTRLSNMLISQTWELLMCCQSSVLLSLHRDGTTGRREGLSSCCLSTPEEGREGIGKWVREGGGGQGWAEESTWEPWFCVCFVCVFKNSPFLTASL